MSKLGENVPAIRKSRKANEKKLLANDTEDATLTSKYSVPRVGSLDHKHLPSLVNGRKVYRKDIH